MQLMESLGVVDEEDDDDSSSIKIDGKNIQFIPLLRKFI